MPYGLVDRPDDGRREPLGWDAAGSSHLAVSGMARSGRSSACLAPGAGGRRASWPRRPARARARGGASDRSGSARAPAPGYRCRHQPAARCRAARAAPLARGTAQAHTLLVVDGWEAVAESLDVLDHGRTTDELLALLRDGERWGLRAVVTGGRGVLAARVSAVLPERLVLRTADPTDLLLAGAAAPTPLTHQPPGRAVHLPPGHEVQLVWPGDDVEVARRVEAVRTRHMGGAPPSQSPLRVRALPRRASLSRGVALSGTTVEVGVGGDDVEPLHLDLGRAPVVAVAGPAASGRSSTLTSWANQLHGRGVAVLAVADSGSPLACGPWPVRDPRAPTSEWPDGVECLLVDDADRLPEPVTRRLAAWTSAAQPGRSLVVATTTDALTSSFAGLASAVRRHRTGVLLQPERPLDGDAFGVVAERPDVRTPGRGLLVVRGRARRCRSPCQTPPREQRSGAPRALTRCPTSLVSLRRSRAQTALSSCWSGRRTAARSSRWGRPRPRRTTSCPCRRPSACSSRGRPRCRSSRTPCRRSCGGCGRG